jgi:hypothetical protein
MITEMHRKIAESSEGRIRLLDGGPESMGVEYQPGDGLRYVVLFHTLYEPMRKAIGCSPYDVMMTYVAGPNRHVGMVTDGHSYPRYIQEKIGLSDNICQRLHEVSQFVVGNDPSLVLDRGRERL